MLNILSNIKLRLRLRELNVSFIRRNTTEVIKTDIYFEYKSVKTIL
jgi:hypothetical protein